MQATVLTSCLGLQLQGVTAVAFKQSSLKGQMTSFCSAFWTLEEF